MPKNSAFPWFKFFATDWISDPWLRDCHNHQVGWYIKLLAYCWQERGLPNDILTLKRLAEFYRDEQRLEWLTNGDPDIDQVRGLDEDFQAVVSRFSVELDDGKIAHPKLVEQFGHNQLTMDARSRGGHTQSRKKRDGRGRYLPGDPGEDSRCTPGGPGVHDRPGGLQVYSRWTPGGPGGRHLTHSTMNSTQNGPGELQVDSRWTPGGTPGELQVRASDSVCVSISESTNNSEKGECEGETAEFDFERAFQDYVRLYRFPVTRMGSCRAQYHSIVFAGDDPVAKSRALTANLEKWVGWWERNLRSRKPLGLLNFLADGDCMVEPPDDIVEPVKKTRLQEMMDSI